MVVLWEAGQSSALETGSVDRGRDVGTVGVFRPIADGQALTFQVEDGRIVDDQTGSVWNVLGEASEGPLAGSTLDKIPHFDTFWFAWSAFRPDTTLIEG